MALNTLTDIRTKVRRLTRSLTLAQLSDSDLDNYINTFVLYDFPEHLRTFNLRKQFTFVTNPYQDEYGTSEASVAGVTTNPLFNFKNLYLTVHPPVYIAGYEVIFSQDRETFFANYPMLNSIVQIGTGDGVTTNFSGTLPTLGTNPTNAGITQGQVLFNSAATNGQAVALMDVPVTSAVNGYKTLSGNLYTPGSLAVVPTVVIATNTINYSTGVYNITFSSAPGAGEIINCQFVPQILSLPQSLLFYGETFTVRPIPDQAYRVNFEVYVRPTELLAQNQRPDLDEWWQYIAYGASKKVFEDRGDIDSVAQIMPEFKKQETLCLRRTIVQLTNERVATIYAQQTSFGGGNNWSSGPF